MTKQTSMTWEAEYDSSRGLLSQKFLPLRFAQPFEKEFRLRMRQQAQITLRSYYWLLFLLFPVSYASILYDRFDGGTWQGSMSDLFSVVAIGVMTFVVVLAMSVSAFLHAFRNSYFLYTAPLTILILTFLGMNTVFLSDDVLQQRSTYPIVYILMIVYGIANMRLVESTLIGFGSMLCVAALVFLFEVESMDWSLFSLYFGVAHFVGVANGFVVETKERRLYLQERLIQLEKRQLNNISERMVQLAREDGLTGLANRRHFSDTFLIEWERARRERLPLSVVFIDIDHFKPYNDNHGHLEGDQALVRVAKTVQLMARRAGDLAARYGGEEFVLLLPNTQASGAKDIAEELLAQVDALKLPHKASSVGPYVSISMGVATVVPDVHIAPTRLIDAADEALYEAKEGGRHRVVVSQGL